MDKVFVEVKDGLAINVDVQNAIDGFEALNYKIIPLTREQIYTKPIEVFAHIPLVGSIDAVSYVLNELKCKPDPIDFPESILKFFPDIKFDKLSNVLDKFEKDKEPIFIKPVKTKLFTGCVLKEESQINYFSQYGDIDVITRNYIKNIGSEWRVYVNNSEIIDIRCYSGNFMLYPSYHSIKELIDEYDDKPVSFTVDVYVTYTGHTDLIEYNDFWAIGCYGMDPIKYADMLAERWFEIVG